jgi:hypothetical protein
VGPSPYSIAPHADWRPPEVCGDAAVRHRAAATPMGQQGIPSRPVQSGASSGGLGADPDVVGASSAPGSNPRHHEHLTRHLPYADAHRTRMLPAYSGQIAAEVTAPLAHLLASCSQNGWPSWMRLNEMQRPSRGAASSAGHSAHATMPTSPERRQEAGPPYEHNPPDLGRGV